VWAELAEALAPDWRVLLLEPRPTTPAQVIDIVSLLDVFGFQHPVLIAEGPAAHVALLLAVWYPSSLAGLVLVDPDGPPDTGSVACPALVVPTPALDAIRDFLATNIQSDSCC
jgi:pimeloyl-ACP methyl ester carboxylesterase